MRVTWKIVDAWRANRQMQVSELARRAGIPERTIYAGVSKDRPLRAATKAALNSVFAAEFESWNKEGRSDEQR